MCALGPQVVYQMEHHDANNGDGTQTHVFTGTNVSDYTVMTELHDAIR